MAKPSTSSLAVPKAANRPHGQPPQGTKLAPEVQRASALIAEIRGLAVTMRPAAIAKQLGVDRNAVYRLLGWRSMPKPSSILPAPPEEVYRLMIARTTDRDTIRRRIDIFCRAITDRAFAKAYRLDLLAIHRSQPDRPLPPGLPVSTN
jgi:hypothetical protein